MNLAEQQILDGTASPSVITHFLKLGSTREAIEQEKLSHETELVKSKKKSLDSAAKVEELYENAIKAMRVYGGAPDDPEIL